MYIEFIIIYIGMGVIAALLLVAIALLILVLKKLRSNGHVGVNSSIGFQQSPQRAQPMPGIAFCVGCGTQFDAAHKVCPKCGRPR